MIVDKQMTGCTSKCASIIIYASGYLQSIPVMNQIGQMINLKAFFVNGGQRVFL